MKKFTAFAFAALIACGAFAQCAPDPVDRAETAVVYNFKFSGKTTAGLYKSINTGSVCDPGEINYTIRIPSTIAGAGVILTCETFCEDAFQNPTEAAFWTTKQTKQGFMPSFSWTFVNVIGKAKKDAEIAFAWDGGMFASGQEIIGVAFAALGKFDPEARLYTSFSGNFAGTLSPSLFVSKDGCSTAESLVWKCDDLEELVEENTVVYGTWSLKLDKSASKKAAKDLEGTFLKKLPKWLLESP